MKKYSYLYKEMQHALNDSKVYKSNIVCNFIKYNFLLKNEKKKYFDIFKLDKLLSSFFSICHA